MSDVIGALKEKTGAVDFFTARLAYLTTPSDVKRGMEKGDVLVLDVRDRESYNKEHIPGARNVPREELSRNFASLPKDKTLVTYCWSLTCFLAPRAALDLAQKGFRVQEMIGGIEEWKKHGMDVEGTEAKKR